LGVGTTTTTFDATLERLPHAALAFFPIVVGPAGRRDRPHLCERRNGADRARGVDHDNDNISRHHVDVAHDVVHHLHHAGRDFLDHVCDNDDDRDARR
jgi:hypothetical protein